MKISLLEALEIAKKSLPDCAVHVEVSIGKAYSFQSDEINWNIVAIRKDGKKNEGMAESDPIFSIALSKLVAEVTRSKAQAVLDVETETKTDTEEHKADETEKKSDDIPF